MAAAGYPNGFKTTIQFMAKAMFQDAFTAAQGNLRDVGIDAKLDAADPGRQAQAEAGTWNNLLLMYNIPANLTADFLYQLKMNLSSKGAKYRDIAFPADYEAKLSQALSELDLQKRTALSQELMTLIVDKYCMVIPIFLNSGITAQSVEVHDLDILSLSPAEWHPEKAWLGK